MTKAVILMYHQVDIPQSKQEQRFCIPPHEFQRQMRWLKQAGYIHVTLEAILEYAAKNQDLPDKAVHITFDDGFVGVLEHAWPFLQEHNIPSTLFALPGMSGHTNTWMWQRGLPRRALLSAHQLRMLAGEGLIIGSHTLSHVHLPEISPQLAKQEIVRSKLVLEELLGNEILHFAYPYGQLNNFIRDMVESSGYHSACSTRSGFINVGDDCFSMRRIDVYGTDRLWQFQQKVTFGTNESNMLKPFIYYTQRLVSRISHQ